MTLEELVLCIIEQSKNEEVKEDTLKNVKSESGENDGIFTINQLIENYSIFTRYNINKAINEKNLPYFCLGSKKYFKKSEIEKWIKQQQEDNKNSRRY